MDKFDDRLLIEFQTCPNNQQLARQFDRRFRARLLHLAERRCRKVGLPPHLAEDVVQDTILALHTTKRHYRLEDGAIWPYIKGFLWNATRLFCRQQWDLLERQSAEDVDALSLEEEAWRQQFASPESEEFINRVIFKTEEPVMRSIVEALVNDGQTQHMVAKIHGVVHTTIGRKVHAFYARARVRIELALAA